MDIFEQLDIDPDFQALKHAQEKAWDDYSFAYKRYQQKLERLERARQKASAELGLAQEAHQIAIRNVNEYYADFKAKQND